MIRRPPRSTRTDTLFPTRRSSDLHPWPRYWASGGGSLRINAACCHQCAQAARLPRSGGEGGMKWMIAFDLDGTLAESKRPLSEDMAATLARLLAVTDVAVISGGEWRSEEHTSEIQSLIRNAYAVFSLKTNKQKTKT